MPILSGLSATAGHLKRILATLITDTFTRTTSGSLGTTDTGQLWEALSGTWYATGSQAKSDTAASSYPVAAVTGSFPSAVTSVVSTGGGIGVSFWGIDSNNYWAAYPHYVTSTSTSCTGSSTGYIYSSAPTCTCGTVIGPQAVTSCGGGATSWTSNRPSCTCGTLQSQSTTECTGTPGTWSSYIDVAYPCECGTVSTRTAYYCVQGNLCNGTLCCDGSGYILPSPYTQASTRTEYRCSNVDRIVTTYRCTDSSITSYKYGCSSTSQTTTTYNQFIRLIQKSGGVVSTIGSDVAISTFAGSIKVVTSGDLASVTAYSDAALTTPVGTASTTNSGAKGNKVGLIKAPSSYNQGTSADNFSSLSKE